MHWKEITVNDKRNRFLYKGENPFATTFKEVLKFHAPGLAPVKDDSGAYHITTQGKALYSKRYDRTFGYYNLRAAVMDKGQWFHIDEIGNRPYTQQYEWTGNYQEELCTVRTFDQAYFHIDPKGKPVYKNQYRYAGDYKDGIACVRLGNGLFRHIDTNGDFVHEHSFTDLGIYHKAFATARDDDGWHHINLAGMALYAQRYLALEPFYNGQALATRFDMGKEVIDERGQVQLKL